MRWEREFFGRDEDTERKDFAQEDGGKKQQSSTKELTVRGNKRQRGERTAGEEW